MRAASHATLSVNRLLASLPSNDRGWVLAHCEPVELSANQVIGEPGERIRQVYFPTDSSVSLINPIHGHAGLGVQLVGNEGMIGISLLLRVDVGLLRSLVQGSGFAWSMTPECFADALSRSSALRLTLDRYLYVSMNQLSQLVACTHFHGVEARLARWLLMSQDRAHTDHFDITHESLALMLGVRRVGITKAAGMLRQHRLIRYSRGHVTVLDRPGLRAAACDCYGVAEALYERILGQ
jgi:CRP-like cAMP-binding protein